MQTVWRVRPGPPPWRMREAALSSLLVSSGQNSDRLSRSARAAWWHQFLASRQSPDAPAAHSRRWAGLRLTSDHAPDMRLPQPSREHSCHPRLYPLPTPGWASYSFAMTRLPYLQRSDHDDAGQALWDAIVDSRGRTVVNDAGGLVGPFN